MASPKPWPKFSPLRFPPGPADGEQVNRVQDLIRQVIDAEADHNWRTFASLPPGAAPGSIATGTSAWLNEHAIYCSPFGDDKNDGTSWDKAVQHYDIGYDKLLAASGGSGGELHIADGTDGYLWLRNDDIFPTGWKPVCPLTVIGHAGPLAGQFGYGPVANIKGSRSPGYSISSRFVPPIWIISSGVPVNVENIISLQTASQIRLGWDYRRTTAAGNPVNLANISTWARDDTAQVPIPGEPTATVATAVVTVTLPTGIVTTDASRTSNVTTLVFASQAPLPLPISQLGQPIKVNSTNGSFGSGTFLVTAATATTVSYAEVGVNVSPVGASIGNWQSHGLVARDRVEVTSVSAEVTQTTYRVFSVNTGDATKFTVYDYYGHLPGHTPTVTVSNPGQYVGQNRGAPHATGMVRFQNIQGTISAPPNDTGLGGPAIDYGESADERAIFEYCNITGGAYPHSVLDPDRSCWLLMDGGSNNPVGGIVRDCRPNDGGVRAYGNTLSSWYLQCQNIQADCNLAFQPAPVVEVVESFSLGALYIEKCVNTDNPGLVNVRITGGADPNQVAVMDCGAWVGQGNTVGTTVWIGSNWQNVTKSAILLGQRAFWADGRVSAKHPGNYRALVGLSEARFANLVVAPASWPGVTGTAVTTGQADPKGGTDAYLLTKTSGTGQFKLAPTTNYTHHIGDRWFFGMWVYRTGGLQGDVGLLNATLSANNLAIHLTSAFDGDGEWQWIENDFTLISNTTGSSNVDIFAIVTSPIVIYQPTAFYVPASVGLTDNEWAEYVMTARPQPPYLLPNTVGTDAGQQLIAHGGMGVASAILSSPSGTATLQKWEPRYNESGASPLYAPLFDVPGTFLRTSGPLSMSWKWSQLSSTIDRNSGSVFVPADVGNDDTGRSRFVGVSGNTVGQTLAPLFATSGYAPMYPIGYTFGGGGSLNVTLPFISATGTGSGTINIELWYCTAPATSGSYTLVASHTEGFNSSFGSALGGSTTFATSIPAGAFVFLAVYRSDNNGSLTLSQVGLCVSAEVVR